MKPLSHYLATELTLSHDEEEIIAYGLFVLLFNGLSVILMFVFGLCLCGFYKTVVFMMSFIPFRLMLGGYHSSTPQQCIVTFTCLSFLFIMFVRLLTNSLALNILTIIMLLVTLWRNHGTNHHERQKPLLLMLAVSILTYTQSFYYIICLGFLMSLLLLNLKIE